MIQDTLAELVSINSVFPNESRLVSHLETRLKKNGFNVQRQQLGKGRFNLLAEKGTKGNTILFYGHIDTVPIYGKWKTDPLRLTKKGGKLFGLGAVDMKGGLSAILEATKGTETERKIKLILCSDEENISKGAWEAVKKRKAWFRDCAFCISGEPGASLKSIGGTNVVTLGRRGRVVISIDILGISSHGARPKTGVNAIDEAAKITLALDGFKLLDHKQLGSESVFVRKMEGASTSLSVPEKAHLEIDMHMVPPTKREDAKKRVSDLVRFLSKKGILDKRTKVSVSIKQRETPYIEPYVDSLSNRHVKQILQVVEKTAGKPVINYGNSVADDNILSNGLGIPVIVIGPRGGSMHANNEWVSEKDLVRLQKLYERIIKEVK